MRRAPIAPWILCVALGAACAGTRGSDSPSATEPARERPLEPAPVVLAFDAPLFVPFVNWGTLPVLEFERELERALPSDAERSFTDRDRAAFVLALDGRHSLRAALILARAREPRAAEALIAWLERRMATADDAACVVAARALATTAPPGTPGRLAALARGRLSHPIFLVRVECAVSALAHGRDDVLPALLDVLRLSTTTPAPAIDPGELEDAQFAAGWAIARRLGEAEPLSPHASLAERAREIDRLAERIAGLAR